MIIPLSSTTKLRPQQNQLFRKFFIEEYKFIIRVAHRRFGKDLEMFTLFWCEAVRHKGIYIYFLPTIGQSRHVIWETIGEDGSTLIDRIPKPFLKIGGINNSDQKITFKNGSILYVTGSDNYKRWVGMNARYCGWSEFQDSDINSLNAMRPMLTKNKGGIIINGTPRAYNQLGELYHAQINNPDWYVTNLTADDTYDEFGNPIITPEMIEQERRNGMPEELIQQEYFGSWDAAIVGSFYGKQLAELKKRNRIDETFKYNPNLVVFTGWDIGWSDHTVIWFIQKHPQHGLVAFDYHEARGQDIKYYANFMRAQRKKYGWNESREINFGPHDVANGSVGAGTLLNVARENGIQFQVVNRPARKIQAIHLVRYKLPDFCFNSVACAIGLKRLTEFRSQFDLKANIIDLNPVHDLASHGADGFQTFVLGYMYRFEQEIFRRQIEYANLYGIDAAI